MNKITTFLENGSHDVYIDGFIKTDAKSKMTVRNVAIYWNFNNITANNNDIIVTTIAPGTPSMISFDQGYWTFDMIKTKLGENDVSLQPNVHNNTCKIYSEHSKIDLGKFAPLLGFPTDFSVPMDTPTISPSTVEINQGLRYVTIGCEVVNTFKNFNTSGSKSNIVSTIPITTDQPLNSTVSFYNDVNSEVPVVNGDHNMLRFEIGTNIGNHVNMSVLLELYIT